MFTPIVTELLRALEPVTRDPFIEDPVDPARSGSVTPGDPAPSAPEEIT
jgi:hypothetical protein